MHLTKLDLARRSSGIRRGFAGDARPLRVLTVGRGGETAVTIIDVVKRIAMISAPIGLIAFSLSHGAARGTLVMVPLGGDGPRPPRLAD
jgi:hypothetical protein